MGTSSSSILIVSSVLIIFLMFSISLGTSSSIHGDFLQCLSLHSQTNPIPIYTPNTSNYSTILESSIPNLRFLSTTTPKPHLIITPLQESHVQAAVICSKKHGIQIKVRSGGHDTEGLSYVSDVPFVMVDMFNLRAITIDVEHRTAWVQAGATLGEVSYSIAKKSRKLGFPSGICPTIGVGGHFSGGGFGPLLRKYGLAADNVIDARIVDVHGRILDKESMGKDLFWAIRGGGRSFGVILSWKIRLVPVPHNVTIYKIKKTLEQGATALALRWQEVAPKLPQELYIRATFDVVNSTTQKGDKTIQATFHSLFLGDVEDLVIVMKERFPELGLERKDCTEMSWIQSVLYFGGASRFPVDGPLNVLLNRTEPKRFYKAKSDYVKEPISQIELEGIWRKMLEQEEPTLSFIPYGGRMSEISEYEIPFPHREGNIFKILYLKYWDEEGVEASEKHFNRIRRMYRYMTPYVSKFPRGAYLNYRDIDLGQSKNGTATYLQSKAWGSKYFKNNYERLVYVKSKVDSENFFRDEQSIPSIASWGKKLVF
ncbi:FAD linked oxidase [Macleaya cordata]|uniref:FAD linked oxidase n=1 Tax=Macleaya cordata TaxID=56857 RepID=A0A200QFW5_MACCD|nr:FAD linked oxidase [Macleaya cordata]